MSTFHDSHQLPFHPSHNHPHVLSLHSTLDQHTHLSLLPSRLELAFPDDVAYLFSITSLLADEPSDPCCHKASAQLRKELTSPLAPRAGTPRTMSLLSTLS